MYYFISGGKTCLVSSLSYYLLLPKVSKALVIARIKKLICARNQFNSCSDVVPKLNFLKMIHLKENYVEGWMNNHFLLLIFEKHYY